LFEKEWIGFWYHTLDRSNIVKEWHMVMPKHCLVDLVYPAASDVKEKKTLQIKTDVDEEWTKERIREEQLKDEDIAPILQWKGQVQTPNGNE
ncbi:hypothetical protein ACDT12_13080, partial [Staphylococcus aureus]